MDAISRIQRISLWAGRVYEFGPQGSRGGALVVIGKCNRAIESILEDREIFSGVPGWDMEGHEREEVEHFLDVAAYNMESFLVDGLIQAPPGLHRRLMRREGYRSRLPFMRSF